MRSKSQISFSCLSTTWVGRTSLASETKTHRPQTLIGLPKKAESVFSAIDLVPSLLDIAAVDPNAKVKFDGEVLTQTLTGNGGSRKQPIFFRRPPDRDSFYGVEDLPDLAMRKGKWKLLCEYDGSQAELYDLENDDGEELNLAQDFPGQVKSMTAKLLEWHNSMPPDNGASFKRK